MANNTSEYWDINGTSLHQYGWSVTTFGGSRYDVPPRRGENLTLAYRPGAVHRAKQPDQRTITLTMFLVGMVPATGVAPVDQRVQFNDSWEFLRRLVWKYNNNVVTLTRRWFLTFPYPGDTSTSGLSAATPGLPATGVNLVVANTSAELSGQMTPTMTGRTRADFSMDLLLPDPYFYAPTITASMNLSTATTVYNAGNDVAAFYGVEIDLVGPITNPTVTNLTTGTYVKYNGAIASGDSVTLYCSTFQALKTSDANQNRIKYVTHGGARHWMGVIPGVNSLKLTATAGTGTAVIRYRPPYV